MNISIIGTGYVGLVSGVCYSEIGHTVKCIDIDSEKVKKMSQGLSPIYEPDLERLMRANLDAGRLRFTDDFSIGLEGADVIVIAVGTPNRKDGTADISYVEQAAKTIANLIVKHTVIVLKSTVPVGTNDHVEALIARHLKHETTFDVVSNPEFLREGSAVKDTFHGDRIVIGTSSQRAAQTLKDVHAPFGIPFYVTDRRSAEMIKYASNAFLATKISFINEIANICEKLGADVESVAEAMGMDQRIGSQFLKAGIGYGGSCFPKDTNALVQIAGNVEHNFELLLSVIRVNAHQQKSLVEKTKAYFGSLKGLRLAVLGLAFKPNTDDMREAASIVVTEELVAQGVDVVAFDPIATEKARRALPASVTYAGTLQEALQEADAALILTEWNEIRSMDLSWAAKLLKRPVIIDGRNCFTIQEAKQADIDYISVGRPSVIREAQFQ